MANYTKPLHDSDVFLIDNFISDNEYLEFDERYFKKTGDTTGTNTYYWNGTNNYDAVNNHFEESRYIDENSNVLLYLKPTGEITCESLNGISKLKLSYFINVESDIQTQVNNILSDIALKASREYVDDQDSLLEDNINTRVLTTDYTTNNTLINNAINLINTTTIPTVDAKTVTNLNSINLINNTTIPAVDAKTATN